MSERELNRKSGELIDGIYFTPQEASIVKILRSQTGCAVDMSHLTGIDSELNSTYVIVSKIRKKTESRPEQFRILTCTTVFDCNTMFDVQTGAGKRQFAIILSPDQPSNEYFSPWTVADFFNFGNPNLSKIAYWMNELQVVINGKGEQLKSRLVNFSNGSGGSIAGWLMYKSLASHYPNGILSHNLHRIFENSGRTMADKRKLYPMVSRAITTLNEVLTESSIELEIPRFKVKNEAIRRRRIYSLELLE